jgi:hypothetical protein
VKADAAAVLAPLRPLLERADGSGLIPFYRDGRPVDGLPADALTTAEVAGALVLLDP